MLNPNLSGSQPVPMEGEVLVLSRRGISFSAKSGSSKFKKEGKLHLSTLRMVFVADQSVFRRRTIQNFPPSDNFSAFDIPLATLYGEKFNQPIFGANNMTGKCPPLDGSGLTEDIKWYIGFKNGGVGTLLPFFFNMLQEMRNRMSQPNPTSTNAMVPEAVAQSLIQTAYVDPSDPTKFYVPQFSC